MKDLYLNPSPESQRIEPASSTMSDRKTARNKCNFCDVREGLEWHHIIPRSLGGTDDDFNMLLVCSQHHAILHGMIRRANISELTKVGLEKAKKRGVKLGASDEVRARAVKNSNAVVKEKARQFASTLKTLVGEMRTRGMSLREIADELNQQKIATARGGSWAATTVKNLIEKWEDGSPSSKSMHPLEAAIRRAIDS
jgi:hypothetical protein